MASAGIRKRTSDRTGRVSYQVWWRLDDGSQGSKEFAKKGEATDYKNAILARRGAEALRRRRLRFEEWASEWWATWSTHPRRSPTALQATDSRLRRYVRPHFDHRLVQAITVRDVQQWQNALEARLASRRSWRAARSCTASCRRPRTTGSSPPTRSARCRPPSGQSTQRWCSAASSAAP